MLRPLAVGLLIIIAGIYIEKPGPYRVLTPEAFGLTEVAAGVFTDEPRQAPELLSLIRKARSNSAVFFGTTGASPRIVVCRTRDCAQTFDLRTLGLAAGYHYMLIGPQGVNERTLTHEFAHIDLHATQGLLQQATNRYPLWFDEGLASYVAGDQRFLRGSARDAAWVRWAYNSRRWNQLIDQRSVRDVYGAATGLVTEVAERHGEGGLKDLVRRVAEGADFDTEYARMMGL